MSHKIIIVTDKASWMLPYATQLAARFSAAGHDATVRHDTDYSASDMVFFLSYSRIVPAETLARSTANLVVHGSKLPEGRGWSPWTWKILQGENSLVLTLFEAGEGVDTGPIYAQSSVELKGDELAPEWQAKQAAETTQLCYAFAMSFPEVLSNARAQVGEPSYYTRRRPDDSELDVNQTIAEQFDLLRVVDNERYPAFFRHRGSEYILKIEKKK